MRNETTEPAAARIDRIRFKAPLLYAMSLAAIGENKRRDEAAQRARAARVGHDDGMRGGRDYGPGLRLRAMRGLRGPDVLIEDGGDPDKPNVTVRRARRSDPLTVLWKARSITSAHFDVGELLRHDLEMSEPSIPSTGHSDVHVAAHQRAGVPDWQLQARTGAREALAAVNQRHRAVLLWVLSGGSLSGYEAYVRQRHGSAAEQLKAALDDLVGFYGAERSLSLRLVA